MKLIFLDIDGVLTSSRTHIAFRNKPKQLDELNKHLFDWVAVSLVKTLCENTQSQCILSSTWRFNYSAQEVSQYFNLPIIDTTNGLDIISTESGFSLFLSSSRGQEIDDWLNKQTYKIDKYIIIDDDTNILDKQKQVFVQVNHSEGFSFANYEKSIKLLS